MRHDEGHICDIPRCCFEQHKRSFLPQCLFKFIMPPPYRAEALSDDAPLTSVCLSVSRLSVAYIGPKSRTERPRKTKIDTEVAHVTRLSRSKGQRSTYRGGAYCGGLPHSLFRFTLCIECFYHNCNCNFTSLAVCCILAFVMSA